VTVVSGQLLVKKFKKLDMIDLQNSDEELEVNVCVYNLEYTQLQLTVWLPMVSATSEDVMQPL
jgi:hypothetical protein